MVKGDVAMTSLNLEIKSFTQFFQKIAVSKGRAFGRTPQSVKNLLSSGAFAGELPNLKFGLSKRVLL